MPENTSAHHGLRARPSPSPGITLNSSYVLQNLIFITVPWGSCSLGVTDEKPKACRCSGSTSFVHEVLDLGGEAGGVWIQGAAPHDCPRLRSCRAEDGHVLFEQHLNAGALQSTFTTDFHVMPTTTEGILFPAHGDAETELERSSRTSLRFQSCQGAELSFRTDHSGSGAHCFSYADSWHKASVCLN